MDIDLFDYELPQDLIAQYPVRNRSSSRLLVVEEPAKDFRELEFSRFGTLLHDNDLVVVNDTRVLPARMMVYKPTGGKVEILLERVLDSSRVLAMLRSSKRVNIGQELVLQEFRLEVEGRDGPFFILCCADSRNILSLFEEHGTVPLPPYIQRLPDPGDTEWYQTVYSSTPGAVAAPTAGLHFDRKLIDGLKARGIGWESVTLHVGAGTFQPVREADIHNHKMHGEFIEVGERVCSAVARARASGGRVVAVGTTVVRALETAAGSGSLMPMKGETNLFITPGFKFRAVDALVTNFHLPRSTLLVLVSAFSGRDRILSAYRYAIRNRFRFFSYGDSMFLEAAC